MRALVYDVKPAGWAACWALRKVWRGCQLTPLNGLSLREMNVPDLPTGQWVRVSTRLAGICGTDCAILAQKQVPDSILQAFSSMPFVLGHENVSVVEAVGAEVAGEWVGRRVCVDPGLSCPVRGIDPPCGACAAGHFGACENFGADGQGESRLPPGTSVGYNRATGGAFAESFVAHVSQLVPVPDSLSDEQAVLTDPLACSLHAVLRSDRLASARRVLVYGAGMLGLGVITSLRAMDYGGEIHVIVRRPSQAKMAMAMGASRCLQLPADRRGRYQAIAEATGASIHRVRFDNCTLTGGYDVVFECVTSAASLTESLRWTRSRGEVIYLGTGRAAGADLTALWFQELDVRGAYGRQIERLGSRQIATYPLVHELMAGGRLKTEGLLTHTFELGDYRRALATAMHMRGPGAIRVAFDFRKQ
ncbi:MAG: alcohol dehydrogenase catalytic domain-containing protein [Planctomycetaceae bacterium]|nr:alcohol dehydrogenase catalytic domain-containing protein [Planctomycetaceae bacterium]